MPRNRTPRVLESPAPPSPEPGTVILETPRLVLRRLLMSDAAALAEAGNHKEVSAVMSDRFPSPYTVEDAEEFISSIAEVAADPHYPTVLGVFAKPEGEAGQPRLIGTQSAKTREDIEYRTWELAYFYAPPAWGKGYASEANRAFVKYCFDTWPRLHRFEGLVYSTNRGSQRVMEKTGLLLEGVRKGAVEKGGELLDAYVYGTTRDEWEATLERERKFGDGA